jgi:hypothetical protein
VAGQAARADRALTAGTQSAEGSHRVSQPPHRDIDAVPDTTMRLVLSSTFRDLRVERDVVARRVFAALRRPGCSSGVHRDLTGANRQVESGGEPKGHSWKAQGG